MFRAKFEQSNREVKGFATAYESMKHELCEKREMVRLKGGERGFYFIYPAV